MYTFISTGCFLCTRSQYLSLLFSHLRSPRRRVSIVGFHARNEMPLAKPKPSEIAAEAKKTYIPYIEQKFPHYPVKSVLHLDSSLLRVAPNQSTETRLRVAVIDGDPVDVALDWYEYNVKNPSATTDGLMYAATRIPVVNMANEKRAGGDWESGLMAPEESLCRRSNLVHALTTTWDPYPTYAHYPIPTKGGIYSPYVGR